LIRVALSSAYKNLCSMKFLGVIVYFLVGASILSWSEDWHLITSLYVCMQIITTIGYGDLTVESQWTQLYMTFFVLFGLVVIADVFNNAMDSIMEAKLGFIRKKLQHLTEHKQTGNPIKNVPLAEKYKVYDLVTAAIAFLWFLLIGTIFFATYESCSCSYGTTRRANYPNCIPANCDEEGEKKSFINALYMSVITMTTVGFGDFTPLSQVGRVFGMWWMFGGVLVTLHVVKCLSVTMAIIQREKSSQPMTHDEIFAKMDMDHLGSISRSEFLHYMILKNDLVAEEDLDGIEQLFKVLDRDGSGTISRGEIQASFG